MTRQNRHSQALIDHLTLRQLVTFHQNKPENAVFAVSLPQPDNKSTFESTFITIELQDAQDGDWWACPTPLCGHAADCYHPAFVMAVLSVYPFPSSPSMDDLDDLPVPQIKFATHPDIRRSMTLNAMRMSTEWVDTHSRRVFELARNRLQADQPDVVHDLLVYLMHGILDARRAFADERALRAESIAAYLGLEPAKVLLLLHRFPDDVPGVAHALAQGAAGTISRQLDLPALLHQQLALLDHPRQTAQRQEAHLRQAIAEVMDIWEKSSIAS